MNGKPVFTVPSKTIINFESGFAPKLLCDWRDVHRRHFMRVLVRLLLRPDRSCSKQVPWLAKHGVTGDHSKRRDSSRAHRFGSRNAS
jgi:hypothetical protein